MSTIRRTPGIYLSKAPRGPNGERLCRNCHGPMPKGARHNCSAECSDEWMCKTSPSHLRYRLQQRDHGICAECGLDTIKLKAEYMDFCDVIKQSWIALRAGLVERSNSWVGNRPWEERIPWLKEHGIPPGRQSTDWWDADHIVPVIEGGGECGLDGYRTLCIPCHKKETASLRKRMSQKRIQNKDLPLLGAAIL